MKSTGLVRRIDDLGRVVIPKEIRRSMRIKEGDPLELFTSEDGVTFKKYSTLSETLSSVHKILQSFYLATGMHFIAYDTCTRISSTMLLTDNNIIPYAIQNVIDNRTEYKYKKDEPAITINENGIKLAYAAPIVHEGSVVGVIACCSNILSSLSLSLYEQYVGIIINLIKQEL